MIYRYDKEIVDKFQKLFNDDRITVQPPENAIRYVAQLENDQVKFPLISLNRVGWRIRENDTSFAQSRIGVADRLRNDSKLAVMYNIPIRIDYQLDVYTIGREQNDEILRELVFYIRKHPTLEVKIPYGLDSKHKFNIFFGSDFEDNSDTVEHINKGVLYRTTCSLYTDDAYLFESSFEDNRVSNVIFSERIDAND